MAITVKLPAGSAYLIGDIISVFDYVLFDAEGSGSFSSTKITGSGPYLGKPASFTITGHNFTTTQVGDDSEVTGGMVDTMAVTTKKGTMTFTSMNIDMSVFSPIILAEDAGTDIKGVERFLLGRNWNFTLGNGDDILPAGTKIGDGVFFNPRGNDVFHGRGGNDNLFSGNGNDKLYGEAGNDRLNGGKGADKLWGGGGGDVLLGGDGADIARGGTGKDLLNGQAGTDRLFGNGGADELRGGAGRDVLDGGPGNDVIWGGGGPDKFVFRNGAGRDRIRDFDANDNAEDIDLSHVTRITGFQDLKAHHMTDTGANVVIDDHAGTVITLVGVDLGDLQKADFIF